MNEINNNPFQGIIPSEQQEVQNHPEMPVGNPFTNVEVSSNPFEQTLQKPQIEYADEGIGMSNQNPNFNNPLNLNEQTPEPFPQPTTPQEGNQMQQYNNIQQTTSPQIQAYPQDNIQQNSPQVYPQDNIQQNNPQVYSQDTIQQPQQQQPQQYPQYQQPQQQYQQQYSTNFQQPNQQAENNHNFNNHNFNNQYSNNGYSNNNQKMKYNIIDFYWLVNDKLKHQQSLEPGECMMITVGFNADFNNMRFSLLNINNMNMLNGGGLELDNCQKITNFNIHSEGAASILANKNKDINIQTYERVISSGSWTPNQTVWKWIKNSLYVYSKPNNNNNFYSYVFSSEQIPMIESAFNFMINGQGWMAALNKK